MDKFEIGMPAVSKAGRDKGCLYVISAVEADYVYLVDGRHKTLEHPKKKKLKHIQAARKIPEELQGLSQGKLKNEDIRRFICQRWMLLK